MEYEAVFWEVPFEQRDSPKHIMRKQHEQCRNSNARGALWRILFHRKAQSLPMEILLLQDFITLSETGVFARAAEKRNITQPAFTRRIKKLEQAVGANLINRSVHPVKLTSAGEKFLPTAQNIVYEWERSRAELFDDNQKVERIRISVLQSLAVAYVPRLVKSLYPNGQSPYVEIIADNFAGCIEAMILGSADAMICYSHKDISTGEHLIHEMSKKLGTDRLIPVTAVENGNPKYSFEDEEIPYLKYSRTSFLGSMTSHILDNAELKLPLNPVYEDSIAAALKSAVLEGLGVAWLPESLVSKEIESDDLKILTMDDKEFIETIDITIYLSSREISKTVSSFWSRI